MPTEIKYFDTAYNRLDVGGMFSRYTTLRIQKELYVKALKSLKEKFADEPIALELFPLINDKIGKGELNLIIKYRLIMTEKQVQGSMFNEFHHTINKLYRETFSDN